MDLATMAQKADVNLAVLYGWCYLEPTFHSHATGFGLSRRLRRNDDDTGWIFREITEKEAWTALHLAHNLILRVLSLHEDYFKLGLEAEIQPRIDEFPGRTFRRSTMNTVDRSQDLDGKLKFRVRADLNKSCD